MGKLKRVGTLTQSITQEFALLASAVSTVGEVMAVLALVPRNDLGRLIPKSLQVSYGFAGDPGDSRQVYAVGVYETKLVGQTYANKPAQSMGPALWMALTEWRVIVGGDSTIQTMQHDTKDDFDEESYVSSFRDEVMIAAIASSGTSVSLSMGGTFSYDVEVFLFGTTESDMHGLKGEDWEDYWPMATDGGSGV